jgi:hypothetical protein
MEVIFASMIAVESNTQTEEGLASILKRQSGLSINNLLPFFNHARHKLNHSLAVLGEAHLSVDPLHGLNRSVDEHALVAVMQLLKKAEYPLRILSLGSGVTWNSDERFGRPFLEEYMKSLWGDRVQIVCSDIRGMHNDFVVIGPRYTGASVSTLGGFRLKTAESAAEYSGPLVVISKRELLRLGEFTSSNDTAVSATDVHILPNDGKFTIRPALDPYIEKSVFGIQAVNGVDYFTDVVSKLLPLYIDQKPDLIVLRHGWPRLGRELCYLMRVLEPLVGQFTTVLVGVHSEIHRFVPYEKKLRPVRASHVFAVQKKLLDAAL